MKERFTSLLEIHLIGYTSLARLLAYFSLFMHALNCSTGRMNYSFKKFEFGRCRSNLRCTISRKPPVKTT
uniref:Ovule protein n=1 Tax=Ascaris lumbricoides TaxID=6252 RepID=A0A0M3IG19_ASCLU